MHSIMHMRTAKHLDLNPGDFQGCMDLLERRNTKKLNTISSKQK